MPDSRIKISLFITLLIACVFFILGGCGSEKFMYTDNGDGTCTITGYDYDHQRGARKVAIPRKINGLTVTTIGKDAFLYCKSIHKLTIPGTVTTIEEGAFFWCGGLDHIAIPDSVTTIGRMAFYDSTLRGDLVIPEGVAEIGNRAFACCPLNSITVSEQNESFTSADGVLYSKDMSVLMQAPAKTKGSFDIPDGVETIGAGAFECCYGLTSVTIPYGVTKIGSRAFDSVPKLESLTLPDSVTEIGFMAFNYCIGMTGKLVIPNNVTIIEGWAFIGCDGLQSLEITGSMVTIGGKAFFGCDGLESITIQGSVDRIGNEAFYGCHRLARAEFLGDAPADFGAEVFDKCANDFTITYDPAKSGWSTPTYNGYPCFPKDADESADESVAYAGEEG